MRMPFDRLRERLGLAVRSFPANRWLSLSKPALGPSLEARKSASVSAVFMPGLVVCPSALSRPRGAVSEESGRWEFAGVREVIHPASRDGRGNWCAGRNLRV